MVVAARIILCQVNVNVKGKFRSEELSCNLYGK
jgi:hypothetical protein